MESTGETIIKSTAEPSKPSPELRPTETYNPYDKSTVITKLQERKSEKHPLRIAFFDVDSTITGDREKTNLIRKKLEDLGYVVVFVTSRTEEMIMSKEQQEKSSSLKRPMAQLGKDEQGKRVTIDPKDVEPEGVLDPDIIAGSTGSRVLVKQKEGGYQVDTGFELQMKMESEAWRTGIIKLINYINKEKLFCQPIPIEDAQNFAKRETDVFPPNFRIQVNFPNLESYQQFLEKINQFKLTKRSDLLSQGLDASSVENVLNLKITDDSKPTQKKFSAYLTPTHGYKARAEEEIVKQVCERLKIGREDLEILIAGDSFPDLGMGLYGGLDTNATFILAGQSRLTQPLITREIDEFAGVGLKAVKNRLSQNGQGRYEFKPPLLKARKLVIGHEAYPGTSNQDSILAFLNELH